MTTSDLERRLTAVLDQHAEEAMNQTDTATELDKFQARVGQDHRGRNKRRAALAAAALSAAAVVVGALWFSFAHWDSPASVNPASPVGSPSPSSASSQAPQETEAPQTPGSTVEGFQDVESFPMTFVVPEGFTPSYEEGAGGTRGYTIDGTSGGASAFLISTLNGSPAGDLPADLATHIRTNRPDLIVSDVGTTEVDGRPAQTFTLTQKPGTAPSDLWCVRAGSCYKLLEDKPLDLTAVRTGQGLVLFEVEYLSEDQGKVQQPMQNWLSSVRWE